MLWDVGSACWAISGITEFSGMVRIPIMAGTRSPGLRWHVVRWQVNLIEEIDPPAQGYLHGNKYHVA